MLILVMMLLVGLFAAVWGFMACFLTEQWDRLTETISFADRWSEAGPRRRNLLMRAGQCAGGLVTYAVGCWFVYIAWCPRCRERPLRAHLGRNDVQPSLPSTLSIL